MYSATGVVAEDFGEFLTVSKGNYTCSQNKWILDTGSSHHLCSRKKKNILIHSKKFEDS